MSVQDPVQNATNTAPADWRLDDIIPKAWHQVLDWAKDTPPAGNTYWTNENIHFPADLTKYEYYMTFEFSKYDRPTIFNPIQFLPSGKIRLPIPTSIIDTMRVNYSEEELGPIMGAALENLKAGNGAGAVTGTLAGTGLSLTGGPVRDPVLQMAGLAVNPFLTVMFKSPSFKRHAFSWRLSPNNPDESNKLKAIVDKFRYHSLPSLYNGFGGHTGGTLLSYPDLTRPILNPDDRFTYKFKPCVIESLSINYAPGITPAFHDSTRAPESVEFQITLLEIEYWLKEDFLSSSPYNPGRRTLDSGNPGPNTGNPTEIQITR